MEGVTKIVPSTGSLQVAATAGVDLKPWARRQEFLSGLAHGCRVPSLNAAASTLTGTYMRSWYLQGKNLTTESLC